MRGIAWLRKCVETYEAEAVINPGNPTGTVLTREVIDAVVRPRPKEKDHLSLKVNIFALQAVCQVQGR